MMKPEDHWGFQSLQAASVDYRSVFMHSTVAHCLSRLDGQVVDCNPLFAAMAGCVRRGLSRCFNFKLGCSRRCSELM